MHNLTPPKSLVKRTLEDEDMLKRPISWIKFYCGPCVVQVLVRDTRTQERRQSKRLRRSVLLTAFRQLRPMIGAQEDRLIFKKAHFFHFDQLNLDTRADAERPVNLTQASQLSNEPGRVGFEIRLRRLELGWTQVELAKRAGVSPKHLVLIERGEVVPRESTWLKLFNALHPD